MKRLQGIVDQLNTKLNSRETELVTSSQPLYLLRTVTLTPRVSRRAQVRLRSEIKLKDKIAGSFEPQPPQHRRPPRKKKTLSAGLDALGPLEVEQDMVDRIEDLAVSLYPPAAPPPHTL